MMDDIPRRLPEEWAEAFGEMIAIARRLKCRGETLRSRRYIMDDTPCGQCKVGIYHEDVIANGVRMFSGMTGRQALDIAPRCRVDGSRHICFGARDFILYVHDTLEEFK